MNVSLPANSPTWNSLEGKLKSSFPQTYCANIHKMDLPIHDEEMDAVLQDMSLEDLHEFAHNIEDDSFENDGQTELLSSIYFFVYLKTDELKSLHQAIRRAIA